MIQINIHLDGRLVRPFRKLTKRRVVVALALAIPVVGFAANTTIPNNFEAGTVISSSKVNENFATLTTSLNEHDTRLTALEAKALPSAGAVFAYAGTSVGDGALTRTFNSAGGTNTLTGTNGLYTVTLGGIDCGAAAPGTGIAVAQAAGASGISCRVNGDWNNVANSCRIFIGCFNGAGSSTATPFSLIYMR